MSADSPRHARCGGPLTVPSQPPSDRGLIDAVSGFINDVKLTSSTPDPKDTIQWARFETADINEPVPEGDGDSEISPLLLTLGYGSGVQVWLIPPQGEAQEVLSWRQGTVRVLRILPTPTSGDSFASKRPLIALCDSASPGPTFCSLSFLSVKGGEQVKSIKFKNPILDVLASKRSIVISFAERFAVFDARTLEDRMAVTTCYPCPCPLGGNSPVNPLALGDRWLAYADKKLNPSKRSSGGCETEGVSSYTATVLHAAKSLGKGLRGLGESFAQSLAGGRGASPPHVAQSVDVHHPGVVTILDIEGLNEDDSHDGEEPYDPIVAHFIAHSEAIIALKFDASGLILVTADRRGHDFHVFRINPHPCGPSLASVHHLYILHRGDTTAKVQDIAISFDCRWTAVSTLRGTTHVFPTSPYGGAVGARTHVTPRLVNRLSRFHRSAGLSLHAQASHRPASPVPRSTPPLDPPEWFPSPRTAPAAPPRPVAPLAQLRPTANLPTHTITRNSSGRQRLSSLSEDGPPAPLLARAVFGAAPAARGAQLSLYLITPNGCLLHLLLHPRVAQGVPKEKICEESPIELDVEGVAQWALQRPATVADLLPPLPPNNPLFHTTTCRRCVDSCVNSEEQWLSQVEIVTHAGPHRRLWMGPQFVFKTYNISGSTTSLSEVETIEVSTSVPQVSRSTPVNMPGSRPIVPVLIDSGSASSLEHSPCDSFRRKSFLNECGRATSVCDVQLKEDLAEAMKEDQGWLSDEADGADGADETDESSGSGRTPAVERTVGPRGTVVGVGVSPRAPPGDVHFRPVLPVSAPPSGEVHFRPVLPVSAPSPAAPPLLRPLPRDVLYPVFPRPSPPSPPSRRLSPPRALSRQTVIPVELSVIHVLDLHAPGTRVAGDTPAVYGTRDRVSLERERIKDSIEERENIVGEDRANIVREERANIVREERANIVREERANIVREERANIVLEESDSKNWSGKSSDSKNVADNSVRSGAASKAERKSSKSKNVNREKRELKESKASDAQEIVVKREMQNEDLQAVAQATKSEPNNYSVDVNKENNELITEDQLPDNIPDQALVSIREEQMETVDLNKDIKENSRKRAVDIHEAQIIPHDSLYNYRKHTLSTSMEQHSNSEDVNVVKIQESYVAKSVTLYEPEPITIPKEPIVHTVQPLPRKYKEAKSYQKEIKTEEQAWDMLLNEDKSDEFVNVNTPKEKESSAKDETKSKAKKSRKSKKVLEETQSKSEDDSFIEIHSIEGKQQENIDDLISVTSTLSNSESKLLVKKKSRGSKQPTPERSSFLTETPDVITTVNLKSMSQEKEIKNDDPLTLNEVKEQKKSNDLFKDAINLSSYKSKSRAATMESSTGSKDVISKSKKSKSLSPFPDLNRKQYDKTDIKLPKELIVIDSTNVDFPEIQITRSTKNRKISPTPEKTAEPDKFDDIIPQPIAPRPAKSWSSIAASKFNTDKIEIVTECYQEKPTDPIPIPQLKQEDCNVAESKSIEDKLFELYKRTNIMVAECDAPTKLNFVEEHHSVMYDLPPLEPLDFTLEDFKLEVGRDNLLEVNETNKSSPICKINIDDILTSIKESTTKNIESSAFNLVDLERVPVKKLKGFSVIENEKFTTQEIKIDEGKTGDLMEKSSDDDIVSPVTSTDSEKDESKSLNVLTVQQTSKQSAKSKKSRRKKK